MRERRVTLSLFLAGCLRYFSFLCGKMSDQSNLRNEGGWFILAHNRQYSSWHQGSEAAGHVAPIVVKQGMLNARAQFSFSFLSTGGSQPMGWCCPHLKAVLLLGEPRKIKSLTATARGCLSMVLDPVELTILATASSICPNVREELCYGISKIPPTQTPKF